MAGRSVTRTAAQIASDLAERAAANELAKKQNDVWFNKFLKDMPQLDDELSNYSVWIYSINDVCKKQNCTNSLLQPPSPNDKLASNDSKNVNMLITHTMDECIRPFMVKTNAYETYACIQTYRPQKNEQRVEILEKVKTIDPSNMKTYVREMKTLQAQLIFIDPNREHSETKAGAYMTRLLDNLTEEQKKEVYWLRDKWRSREHATDLNCFQVGKKLQEFFLTAPIEFAQAEYGRNKQASIGRNQQRGQPTERNPCGVQHFNSHNHTWAECFSNPINAQKKADHIKSRNKYKPNGQGKSATDILQAKLATAEALNKVYAKKLKTPTAASAIAEIDAIMEKDNEAEQEAALIELSHALNTMKVNSAGSSSCYLVATALNTSLNGAPILDSGASTTFVTSDDYLTNPRKHRTPVTTANGKSSFTQSSGKLKLTETSNPIYLPALSAPDFNQNIISVGQLAMKHDVLFTKKGFY